MSPRRSLVAAVVLALLLAAVPAAGSEQHAAGLVIDTGERVVTVYVEFAEESITGEQLLRRAAVDARFATYGGQGTAVCSILGVGSPEEDCFREAEQRGLYWNYSRARDGAWTYSNQGVSNTTVRHGDVDGWAWGSQGAQPPYRSFEEIQAEHRPSPEPTPTPEPTPSPPPPPSEQPASTATSASTPPTAPTTAPPPSPGPSTAPPATTSADGPIATLPAASASPDGIATVRATEAVLEPVETASGDDVAVLDAAEDPGETGTATSVLAFLLVVGAIGAAIGWRRRRRTD